jgi:uncharacterized protein YndB with AHSA1/START domain
MATITRLTELDASPSAVWKLLTDTDASQRYAPVRSIAIERPGHDDPDGVGQVRAIKTWAGTVREEVTTFEPEHRFGYTLLSGVPVRDYRGTITLEPCQRGTRYRWEIQLEAAWYLLPLLILITKRTVRSTVRGLAEELARRAED